MKDNVESSQPVNLKYQRSRLDLPRPPDRR
ncbi:protein of unknown function [Pararobbsia alpina]